MKINELKKLSEIRTAKDIMIFRRDMVDEGIMPESAAVNPPLTCSCWSWNDILVARACFGGGLRSCPSLEIIHSGLSMDVNASINRSKADRLTWLSLLTLLGSGPPHYQLLPTTTQSFVLHSLRSQSLWVSSHSE